MDNHVFTCATCRRQWTVHSTEELECFFVGLCYWCIQKTGLSFDEIVKAVKILATEERFAEDLTNERGVTR